MADHLDKARYEVADRNVRTAAAHALIDIAESLRTLVAIAEQGADQ